MKRREFFSRPLSRLKNIGKEETPRNVDSENNDNIDFCEIISSGDFTDDLLFSEMMRRSIDPATISKEEMIRIITDELTEKYRENSCDMRDN